MRKPNSKTRKKPLAAISKIPVFPILSQSRTKDLRALVVSWNNKFPVDYWWRKHHSIPFGSRQHLEMSFISMAFEYIEFVEYEIMEIQRKLENKRQADIKNNELFNQIPVEEGKRVVNMTRREIQDEFDNLDLSQF